MIQLQKHFRKQTCMRKHFSELNWLWLSKVAVFDATYLLPALNEYENMHIIVYDELIVFVCVLAHTNDPGLQSDLQAAVLSTSR